MLFSTCSTRAAALGGCCQETSRLGRRGLRLVQAVAYRWDLGASERRAARAVAVAAWQEPEPHRRHRGLPVDQDYGSGRQRARDRKSTRLNSSHANISYAVFCLKKKTRKPRWERS